MRSFFVLTCFLLILNSIEARDVIINGTFPGAEGKELRVYSYADMITYNESLIAKSLVDKNSKFSIKLNIDDVSILFLKVDFYKSSLYAEPGKTYNLIFDTLYPKAYDESSNPFLSPLSNFFEIDNLDNSELNYLINRFNVIYSQFLTDNFLALLKKRNKKNVEDFKLKTDSMFAGIKNEYFLVYSKYKIAAIEEASQTEPRNSLFGKYFYNKPIYLNNVGYMEFFNQFFNKFFTNITQKIKFKDLEAAINEQKSYAVLMDTLGKDSLLHNELLREMVLIKGLADLYYVKGFDKESIKSILNTVADKSKFIENRNIAKNILKQITGFPVGTTATDFQLVDKKQKSYSLSQFKGKYVYLFFWNTSCSVCLSEMDLLNDLKKKFAGKLEIIGISIDMEPLNMYNFLEKKTYDFPLVHFAYNYHLTDNFYVRNLPFFVLIDYNGKIIQCPANKPSENLSQKLELLFNNK